MRAIDTVRKAFHASRRMIEVPEWPLEDGTPMLIYSTPLTGAEHEGLQAREPKTAAEYNILALIAKAKDVDGNPLFTYGDKHILLEESAYTVVIRIMGELNKQLSMDEAKKNLEMTTDSDTALPLP